jgi:precorrin-6A/cobalt-precorrin-6A reductase
VGGDQAVTTRVLILGGTGEARRLAGALTGWPGLTVTSAMAGRTGRQLLPEGDVRIGGFDGPNELAEWLDIEEVDAVIDATDPFAREITAAAADAARLLGVPLLVLRRPGARQGSGDDWHWVDSAVQAASRLPLLGTRVLLSAGRQGLAEFAHLDGLWFLIRSAGPPPPPLPARHRLVPSRGPFTVPGELALLEEHRIDVLLGRDSGDTMAAAKLDAARLLGLPVVLIARPPLPAGVSTVDDPADAVAWVHALRRGAAGG